MAAQIIPFPKLGAAQKAEFARDPEGINTVSVRHDPATHIHIVGPSTPEKSQQAARRIVKDVCFEYGLEDPAVAVCAERPAAFWATLPVPPSRVETPFTVARRVAHLFLPLVEHAY